jgi:hypothetical protein
MQHGSQGNVEGQATGKIFVGHLIDFFNTHKEAAAMQYLPFPTLIRRS